MSVAGGLQHCCGGGTSSLDVPYLVPACLLVCKDPTQAHAKKKKKESNRHLELVFGPRLIFFFFLASRFTDQRSESFQVAHAARLANVHQVLQHGQSSSSRGRVHGRVAALVSLPRVRPCLHKPLHYVRIVLSQCIATCDITVIYNVLLIACI